MCVRPWISTLLVSIHFNTHETEASWVYVYVSNHIACLIIITLLLWQLLLASRLYWSENSTKMKLWILQFTQWRTTTKYTFPPIMRWYMMMYEDVCLCAQFNCLFALQSLHYATLRKIIALQSMETFNYWVSLGKKCLKCVMIMDQVFILSSLVKTPHFNYLHPKNKLNFIRDVCVLEWVCTKMFCRWGS